MLEYTCKCGEAKTLTKATMKVIDGKIITMEALCNCGDYMEEVETEFKGFPSLIRTDSALSRNGIKNYQRYLRKNGKGKEADDIDKKL